MDAAELLRDPLNSIPDGVGIPTLALIIVEAFDAENGGYSLHVGCSEMPVWRARGLLEQAMKELDRE